MATSIFRQGSTDSIDITSKSFQKILFSVFAKTGVSFDPNKIRVSIQYTLNGEDIVIANSTLAVLHALSTYFTGAFEFLFSNAYAISNGVNLYYPLEIDFGHIINLVGTDKINVQITANTDAWYDGSGTALDTQNYINMNVQPAIGNMEYIPKLVVTTLASSTTSKELFLGDNITRLAMFNTDIKSIASWGIGLGHDEQDVHKWINNVNIFSDKMDRSMPYHELLHFKHTFFPSQLEVYYRPYQYILHQSHNAWDDIDGVTLNLDLVADNVKTGYMHVAYQQGVYHPLITQRSVERGAKHERSYLQKALLLTK